MITKENQVKATPAAANFGWTDTTTTSNRGHITPYAVAPVTNFAKVVDEAEQVVLTNKTCPLDQPEQLTYTCKKLDRVTSTIELQHPLSVRNGVQYVVKVEEVLRQKDTDGNIISDEPIVMYLTVRHQLTGNISNNVIEKVLKRLVGACYKDSDNTMAPRFEDLMRSALVPVTDLTEISNS